MSERKRKKEAKKRGGELTASEKKSISQIFDQLDSENSGYLEEGEIKLMMRMLNNDIEPSAAEFQYVLQNADKDYNGKISKPVFIIAVVVRYARLEANHELKEAKKNPDDDSCCCVVS